MKKLLLVVGILFVVAWLAFVWPTQWKYHQMRDTPLRVNRFTDRTEVLGPSGWYRVNDDGFRIVREMTDKEVGITNPYSASPEAHR